jgi:uroporphyrinogen decarboxylase
MIAYENPPWFGRLLERLVEESVDYLSAQIRAGAEVVQIFESWAGDLPPALRIRCVDEPLRRLTAALRDRHPAIPVIVFARGVGAGQRDIHSAVRPDALSVESELSLRWIAGEVDCPIQGNLDPVALLAEEGVAVRETRVLAGEIAPGRHIFNLGHGMKPETDPSRLTAVIKAIRQHDAELGYG